MSKEILKKNILETQNGECAISGVELPDEMSLVDTDRITPKAAGGIYTLKNTLVVNPVIHMKRHGTYRVRTKEYEELKNKVDARNQILKLQLKISNQLTACFRQTDQLDEDTKLFLEQSLVMIAEKRKETEKKVLKAIKDFAKKEPFVATVLGVKGVGPLTVANCIVYIDLDKARHASSLWAYVGHDKASHKRYEKGVTSGGNKTLRTSLYTMAVAQVKTRGAYRDVYDNVKQRLENSERIVPSRNTQGKLVEMMWKDTKPCHRHGAALRAIAKHFLADFWFVGRTLYGLETTPLYVESMLGGTHRVIQPIERGWIY